VPYHGPYMPYGQYAGQQPYNMQATSPPPMYSASSQTSTFGHPPYPYPVSTPYQAAYPSYPGYPNPGQYPASYFQQAPPTYVVNLPRGQKVKAIVRQPDTFKNYLT
jgi:hypothetical protein